MPFTDAGVGRPVVLLHGWATDGGYFDAQAPLAGRGLRLIRPDLPGHGRNPAAGRRLDIAALADAVDDLVRALGLADVVLVGWSMGAAVAFDYVRRHGTKALAGLVVVDMTARIAPAPDWTLGLRGEHDAAKAEHAAAAMRADWPPCADRIAPQVFAASRPADDPLVAATARRMRAADGWAMADLWLSLVAQDDRALLPAIDIPVLVVSGAESRLYGPEVGAAIARAVPDGRHVVIEGAGHAPHLERPERFNAVLEAFVRGLGRPAAEAAAGR